MKPLIALAAVVSLAGCGERAEEAPAAAETTAVATAPAPATGTTPGTYDVSDAGGTLRGTTTINADGTYVDVSADGKVTEKGTFAVKDGRDCFTPEGGKPEECWTITPPGTDGSFTATSQDGKTVLTIRPAASGAAAAATPAATPAPAAT